MNGITSGEATSRVKALRVARTAVASALLAAFPAMRPARAERLNGILYSLGSDRRDLLYHWTIAAG